MTTHIEWCCNQQILPLFNDIKYMDYFEPWLRTQAILKIESKAINKYYNIKKNKINDTIIQ
jgi:hypothetical protein